jgi:pSer/pThr/pTyr-binding forkhead associated (FHA) protein
MPKSGDLDNLKTTAPDLALGPQVGQKTPSEGATRDAAEDPEDPSTDVSLSPFAQSSGELPEESDLFDKVDAAHRPASRRERPTQGGAEPLPAGDAAWVNFEEGADPWLDMSQSGVGPLMGVPSGEATSAHASMGELQQEHARQKLPAGAPQSASQAPAVAHLLGLNGALQDQVLKIFGKTTTVGRATRNDIVLADPSMSRQHAQITYAAGVFTLIDQKSGNGTFVGGRRIDKVRLTFGDELAFGNVKLRFLSPTGGVSPAHAAPELAPEAAAYAPAAAAAPQETSRPSTVAWASIALGLALLSASVCAGYSAHFYRQQHRETQQSSTFTLLRAGLQQFSEHRFDDAERRFNEVLAVDPLHPRARRYLRAVARERLAAAQLELASSYLQKHDLARAYSEATGVLDSTYRPEAERLLHDIDGTLEGRMAAAQTAMEAGQGGKAQQMLTLVEAVHPGRPDVAAVLVRANLQGNSVHVAPVNLVARAAARRHALMSLPGRAGEALRSFVSGDVPGALQALEAVNSEAGAGLREKIERFAELYETGQAEHRAKRAQNAISSLTQARALEGEISMGHSRLLPDIQRKLADMYYVQGTQSLLGGKLPQAYRDFHTGVELFPDHLLCARALTELVQKAQEMLNSSLAGGDKAKIRSDLHTILEITPADSAVHREAKLRLETAP